MTAILSLLVIKDHQHCTRRRGKRICQAISALCGWTLQQHIGGCAVQSLTDVMLWQFHRHHHCIYLNYIDIAPGSIDKVSVQLPTWLWMFFPDCCTTWYHHPILASCDDSSIIIAYQWGVALTSHKIERQKDLPSKLRFLQLNFVTAGQRMSCAILYRCDGMAIQLLSSLHIVKKHEHCSRK